MQHHLYKVILLISGATYYYFLLSQQLDISKNFSRTSFHPPILGKSQRVRDRRDVVFNHLTREILTFW